MPTRGNRSVKGKAEILDPLMAELTEGVEWGINDNDYTCARTREEMVDWYHSIDVLLCTSINDGTPSPVFEAASCARTIVATDVGNVTDWFMPHAFGLIAPRYSNADEANDVIDHLKQQLIRLRDNRDILAHYGFMLRGDIEKVFSWKHLAPRYLAVVAGDAPKEGWGDA